MKLEQRALRFPSGGNALIGIVDVPERPLGRGMLLLHDSLQYRAGSHRQFTLLSRLLAARGVAVLRFDCTASGDSAGGLDAGKAERAEDIAAAMKEFFIHVPEMKESVILAPGDAAPAAAAYARRDARVTGLALLEPLWPAPAVRPPFPSPSYSAADRLFRRAAAFRRAAVRARADADAAPVTPMEGALGDYGGQVLVVGGESVDPARPRSRHVAMAPAELMRRSAWRDAVAFACASWLTSW